jgi:hypothetical protein
MSGHILGCTFLNGILFYQAAGLSLNQTIIGASLLLEYNYDVHFPCYE